MLKKKKKMLSMLAAVGVIKALTVSNSSPLL